MTKVAIECALGIDEEGSHYEDNIMSFSDILHELDNVVHVPLDLANQRGQEFMDKCCALVEELNGTRQEILKNAENNISTLAIELQTTR